MAENAPRELVYGPVPSRRLGRSLGVDLVPLKVCPFDCIYCQLGRTTNKTLDRAEYVSAEQVVSQVREKLASGVRPDYITLAGSGEPTLHSRLGWIIERFARHLVDMALKCFSCFSLLLNRVGEISHHIHHSIDCRIAHQPPNGILFSRSAFFVGRFRNGRKAKITGLDMEKGKKICLDLSKCFTQG